MDLAQEFPLNFHQICTCIATIKLTHASLNLLPSDALPTQEIYVATRFNTAF